MILEIIAFNYMSAILAYNSGADRLEVCDNKLEGCTTPSIGLVKLIKETINIPVFPMIRPRGGDFLYTDQEIEIMKYDISAFRDLGCEGVVFGCLSEDGTVDIEKNKALISVASHMETTFHRAFDRTNDPFKSLDQIIGLGFRRVLTSGHRNTAIEGIGLINELIKYANNRIIVIPGGGIDSQNILLICERNNIKEIHSPAIKNQPSKMKFKNTNLSENLHSILTDESEIRRMKEILRNL